jgi:hypothetical protein
MKYGNNYLGAYPFAELLFPYIAIRTLSFLVEANQPYVPYAFTTLEHFL